MEWIEKASRRLLDFAFPRLCAVCNTILSDGTSVFCEVCEEKLEWLGEHICLKCSRRVLGGPEPKCAFCVGLDWPFEKVVALGQHEGQFRELLLRFKLGGERYLADEFGRRLARKLKEQVLDARFDVVVAVPMRWWALWRRRYNPAEVLAERIACRLQKPLCANTLAKIRRIAPQTELTGYLRLENVKGAFGVRKPKRINGKGVLLVDDVVTTGATVGECSRVLLEAGARSVLVAAVTRAS